LGKVWDKAMQAKDDEIKRLVAERDRYQSLVFKRLLSSDIQEETEGDSASGSEQS